MASERPQPTVRRSNVLIGYAILFLAFMFAIVRVESLARDIEGEAHARIVHVCETQNAVRDIISTILRESRELREQEGRMNPDVAERYDRQLARLEPRDCLSLEQEVG